MNINFKSEIEFIFKCVPFVNTFAKVGFVLR